MRLNENIRHFLKYPLMWVMLLWAITLPGHELAVYSYLVKGSVAEVVSSLKHASGEQDDFSVNQQAVQVFLDADTTPSIVLSPQQAIRCFLQFFAFAAPTNDLAGYALHSAGAALRAQFFPITIQPNAP